MSVSVVERVHPPAHHERRNVMRFLITLVAALFLAATLATPTLAENGNGHQECKNLGPIIFPSGELNSQFEGAEYFVLFKDRTPVHLIQCVTEYAVCYKQVKLKPPPKSKKASKDSQASNTNDNGNGHPSDFGHAIEVGRMSCVPSVLRMMPYTD
jgi:hypothetical protein